MYNGELRHSSNSAGAKYGTTYKAGDIIGVYLDMIEVIIIINYHFRELFLSKKITNFGESPLKMKCLKL
jgi:hypothetical protein